MKPEAIIEKVNLPDGRVIEIETGRLAKQADGAAVVKLGTTMLLATVVSAKEAADNIDFMPLTVDYREKFSATGRFPGGFLKRENRPSDNEILISRLIDRALRPLFPEDYHAETQVQVTLISAKEGDNPDALACLAAAAALAVSDIPFNGPVSEVRVARINGQWRINPDATDMEQADIDLIVAGTKDSIVMVEGEMKEVQEKDMIEAIKQAHETIKKQCEALERLAAKVPGANSKREYQHETHDEELEKRIRDFAYEKYKSIALQGIADKHKRKELFKTVQDEFEQMLTPEELAEKAFLIKKYFHNVQKEAVREVILEHGKRLDGRKTDEIRPIWGEVDYLPIPHGSAIFTRGETQSLTTVTLGTKLDEQTVDGALYQGSDKFILHYNFPAFSTGEIKPNRGPGRREIGHGNLAMRALKYVIPGDDENPYTIRVVSDILESNGSSSMATVCAGSMALMDAGVKIKSAVSGIAMGLITDEKTGRWAVLSDILGDEDHLGDMDFKVAGTSEGITACQMDIKIQGLNFEILEKALEQAKRGRLHILEEMNKIIDKPRDNYKPHVPRILSLEIPKDMIGAVIGPGGKIIQSIQQETKTTITIEEKNGVGVVEIAAVDESAGEEAIERIKAIITVPEVGEVYKGKVKAIMPFGAFIEILPGKDGLLHISEIDWKKTEKVEDVLKEGDEVMVKLIGVDSKTGKMKLSRKALLEKPKHLSQKPTPTHDRRR